VKEEKGGTSPSSASREGIYLLEGRMKGGRAGHGEKKTENKMSEGKREGEREKPRNDEGVV